MVVLKLCALLINLCIPFHLYDTLEPCMAKGKLLIEDITVSAFCFDIEAEEVLEVKHAK